MPFLPLKLFTGHGLSFLPLPLCVACHHRRRRRHVWSSINTPLPRSPPWTGCPRPCPRTPPAASRSASRGSKAAERCPYVGNEVDAHETNRKDPDRVMITRRRTEKEVIAGPTTNRIHGKVFPTKAYNIFSGIECQRYLNDSMSNKQSRNIWVRHIKQFAWVGYPYLSLEVHQEVVVVNKKACAAPAHRHGKAAVAAPLRVVEPCELTVPMHPNAGHEHQRQERQHRQVVLQHDHKPQRCKEYNHRLALAERIPTGSHFVKSNSVVPKRSYM